MLGFENCPNFVDDIRGFGLRTNRLELLQHGRPPRVGTLCHQFPEEHGGLLGRADNAVGGSSDAKHADGAKALVKFITAPSAAPVIRKHGLEEAK